MTPPALPTLPRWMCAAAARPESFEKVNRHVTLALSLSISMTLPVKSPTAPVGTPVRFGTSKRALRLAVRLYVSFCGVAQREPGKHQSRRCRRSQCPLHHPSSSRRDVRSFASGTRPVCPDD